MYPKKFRIIIAIFWFVLCIISIMRTNWLLVCISAIVMCVFLYKAFNKKNNKSLK